MSENRAVHVGGNISSDKDLQLESVKGTQLREKGLLGSVDG